MIVGATFVALTGASATALAQDANEFWPKAQLQY